MVSSSNAQPFRITANPRFVIRSVLALLTIFLVSDIPFERFVEIPILISDYPKFDFASGTYY